MKRHQCPTCDQALSLHWSSVHKMNEFTWGGREPGSRLSNISCRSLLMLQVSYRSFSCGGKGGGTHHLRNLDGWGGFMRGQSFLYNCGLWQLGWETDRCPYLGGESNVLLTSLMCLCIARSSSLLLSRVSYIFLIFGTSKKLFSIGSVRWFLIFSNGHMYATSADHTLKCCLYNNSAKCKLDQILGTKFFRIHQGVVFQHTIFMSFESMLGIGHLAEAKSKTTPKKTIKIHKGGRLGKHKVPRL